MSDTPANLWPRRTRSGRLPCLRAHVGVAFGGLVVAFVSGADRGILVAAAATLIGAVIAIRSLRSRDTASSVNVQ
jgi:hypothetical protein